MRWWHWGRSLQVGKTNRRFEGQWEGGEGAATPGNNRWVMWGISCLHRTEITTAFATWIIQAGWRIRSCNDRREIYFWQIRFCRIYNFQSQIQLKSMAVPSSVKMKGSWNKKPVFLRNMRRSGIVREPRWMFYSILLPGPSTPLPLLRDHIPPISIGSPTNPPPLLATTTHSHTAPPLFLFMKTTQPPSLHQIGCFKTVPIGGAVKS